jgi:hypothetical protein
VVGYFEYVYGDWFICRLTHKFAALICLCFQITAANLCFQNSKNLENQDS